MAQAFDVNMIIPYQILSNQQIPNVQLVPNPLFVKVLDDRIVGSVGAQVVYVRQVRCELWKIELLVLPDYRRRGHGTELLDHACCILETQSPTHVKGLFLLVGDMDLQQQKKEAIWPRLNFVYLGNTGSGAHIRVRYFRHQPPSPTFQPVVQ